MLFNWTQFPHLVSMTNKRQDQFKDRRIALDVCKPEEMIKSNFHGDIHHRYTFLAIYPTVISYSCLSLLSSSFEMNCLNMGLGRNNI